MENPPSVLLLPAEFTKLTFRNLYIRRTGPGSREVTVEGRCDLDTRYISDFPVYDGRGSDASLVARVQGITSQIGNAHQLFTILFETERYILLVWLNLHFTQMHACAVHFTASSSS